MLPYRQWEVPAGFCQQVGNGFVETSSDGDVETERRPVRKAAVAPMKAWIKAVRGRAERENVKAEETGPEGLDVVEDK